MNILIATGNAHKLKELLAILPRRTQTGEILEYVSLADFPDLILPPETGTTLQENAQIKALSAARLTGRMALSDDTGLQVDFLGGRPGVHTARYGGEPVSTIANNQKLLRELAGVPTEKRSAQFCTVACIATPDGKCTYFTGILKGKIALDYCGTHGFGYDPLFVIADGRTLAELSEAEKNTVSHRAQAFKQVSEFLVQL